MGSMPERIENRESHIRGTDRTLRRERSFACPFWPGTNPRFTPAPANKIEPACPQ